METDAEKRNLGQMCHAFVCRRTEPAESTMPQYLWNFQTQKVEILHTFRQGQVLFSRMKIFRPGEVWARSAPSVNLVFPHILETFGARKLKFYTYLDRVMCTFRK